MVEYLRQLGIFNPINQKFKIVVFGAGSLGSFITLNLAKMGFNDITVYDFDKVEEKNIPNQFYRMQDIGKQKVEALKEIIKEFTDIEIRTVDLKVTDKTELPLELNNLYILTFDTLEARRIIFNKLKDLNCVVLDVRAGGEEFSIQVADTSKFEDLKVWDKSFDGEPVELPCSEKSIIYTNLVIAGETCNIVKKINNDQKFPKKVIRHMKGYTIINDLKSQGEKNGS